MVMLVLNGLDADPPVTPLIPAAARAVAPAELWHDMQNWSIVVWFGLAGSHS